MDTQYGTIRIDSNTARIPADVRIQDLRWKSGYPGRHYGYYGDYRGLSGKAVETLAKAGVVQVKDLEDWSEAKLTKLAGITKTIATKLLATAKLADVNYRGKGWPWEVTVTVEVPTRYVRAVSNAKQQDVKDALATMMAREPFFGSLEHSIKEAQREKLTRAIEALEKQLEAIS